MRVEILGDERRRRWSDESKLEIVLSVGFDGASVTEVARRYSVTRQQIYTWRRELRKKGLLLPPPTPVFLPLDMPPPGDNEEARTVDGMQVLPAMMELQLRCGRNLRFSGDVDVVALKRLIRAIEAV
ncbi:IS66-like element accessory protein TnpA [Rhizobium jaguaris]|uniref:Transposase n=1 Tax=Rhizobium jaguaris TaxID=1312183 RepID=A0A387FT30_9HYPH|nr:transposase [Rhizobium jaguaris]AYG57996.1 transposase [Rhizobium jaguaris]AYG64239.1 transposase [Rhizobium jaguaris]